MYVVKVGEYYVGAFNHYDSEITLSLEIMRGFSKDSAKIIAKKVNGEVIEIEEVTNGES